MSVEVLQESNQNLTIRVVDLISSLSALWSLLSVDIENEDEYSLIQQAIKALMHNQDMECCSVFLLNGDYLENISGLDWQDLCDSGDNLRPRKPKRFKLGEGIVGQAALSKELHYSSDCKNDTRFAVKNGNCDNKLPGSLISAPIELRGEIIGVLNISHPHTDFFSEWHKRLVSIYCKALAQLIMSWRLFYRMEGLIKDKTKQLEVALENTQKLMERFERLSMIDELTGLHNRRYFFPEGEAACSRAVRYRLDLAVLLIDLDYFKRINDSYGHDIGDKVLCNIAFVLKKEVREGDIVARFGGEEFVIVAPNADEQQSFALANRIRQSISQVSINSEKQTITVTASIGVCNFDVESKDAPEATLELLLKNADKALYEAKARGRNHVVACDHCALENSD